MKIGGGHFAPKLGGQFELESGGHFKLELGGQYHWNLHFMENFKNNSFREASIIKKYTKTLDYSKIKYSKKVKELIRSKEYILWSKLDKKFDRDEDFLEDFSNYSFDDYNEFLKSLQVMSENKYNNYSCIEVI